MKANICVILSLSLSLVAACSSGPDDLFGGGGTGGEIETGGGGSSSQGDGGSTTTTSASGGGGQTAGTGCTPKTCDSVGANCGQLDTGCGQVIECGSCTADFEECGGVAPAENQLDPEPKGVANVCGGGCTRQTHPSDPSEWLKCGDTMQGNVYRCSMATNGTEPFLAGCVSWTGEMPAEYWCCQ